MATARNIIIKYFKIALHSYINLNLDQKWYSGDDSDEKKNTGYLCVVKRVVARIPVYGYLQFQPSELDTKAKFLTC